MMRVAGLDLISQKELHRSMFPEGEEEVNDKTIRVYRQKTGETITLQPNDGFHTTRETTYVWDGTRLVEQAVMSGLAVVGQQVDKAGPCLPEQHKGEEKMNNDKYNLWLMALVNLNTKEVTQQWVVAKDEEEATLLAALQAGITLEEYKDDYEIVAVDYETLYKVEDDEGPQ